MGKKYMSERLAEEGICLVVKKPELMQKYFPATVIRSAFQQALRGFVQSSLEFSVEVGE